VPHPSGCAKERRHRVSPRRLRGPSPALDICGLMLALEREKILLRKREEEEERREKKKNPAGENSHRTSRDNRNGDRARHDRARGRHTRLCLDS